MEKHNEKKLKNMLSDRAKYHKKFQKGMSPFCSLNGEPISIGGGLCENKESLTGTTQDIGKIVRCKRNAKDRFTGEWRIVGVREKVYRGYTDVMYDLKPVDMPPVNAGVTATCDWFDMELVPEKPAAKEAPKRDGSHLLKKYLTPESFKFVHDVEDVSTPGNWHSDGAIVTFMYGADKYRLDVQGGWTNDSQKFWLVELKNLTKDTYYQKVDKSGKDIGYVYGSLDIGKLLTSSNWSEVNPRGKSMKTSHLTDSLNKTKLKEEFVGKPEVGKTYWFKHSGGIRSGEFTRQTTSLNCFYVPEVDREVCIPIWANIATSREDIEGIEGVVDKMEKDTKVPTKMRAYNGKFFPVNEAVSAAEHDLVVYNGTNTENFDYSTVDLSNSREIGLHCGTEDDCRDRGYKFINKLTLQSPKILSLSFDMTDVWSSIEFVRRLAQYDLFDEKQLESLENQMRKCADSPNKYIEYSTLLREFFLNKGYNVISYPNEGEDAGSTSYIVIDMSIVHNDNKMEESMKKFPGRAQLIGALKSFDKNGKSSTRGNWRIANGGYDLAFEVYYNNTPVAQGYTDGTLTTDFDTTEFGFSKSDLRDVITSVYSDMKTSGNILYEAFEKGVKVYEVEKDGPPDVGRQIIAFVDSHEEYTILTRQDKEYVNKQKWDDKEGHKSEDGEYYSGKNGWIYSLGYTKYIYLDELDLVPQRHHDKVEKEKQAGVAQKQAITDKLISIYGEELGNKLAEKCISVSKDGRRVELVGYDKNLIQVAGYASALKSLYDSMSNEFGPDIAKEIVLKSPSVTTPRYHSVYKIPLKISKDIPWSYYLGCGYSAEVVNGVLVLTELHNKASYSDLEDRLKRDKILDPNSYKSLRSYAVNESLDLNEKKKKKKPYDSINYNAGNVEYNVAMFNKMNSPIAQPTVNPINGIMGDACCEALEDRKKEMREGMRLTNGMKEDESLYFDDGDYSYHIFRRTPFGSNAETEWAVLVVDYGLRFHHDKMYKDEKTGMDTIPVDVVHDKPKKIAYFEFTDETLPDAANAFLDEDEKKFTEVIKAEAQKHIEITEDLDTEAEPKDVITEVGKQELRDFLTGIICEREDDLALEFGEDDRLWDEFFEVNLESYTDKYREDIIKHFNLTTKED